MFCVLFQKIEKVWLMDYKGNRQTAQKGITSRLTKSSCCSIYNKPLLLSLYKSHTFLLSLEKRQILRRQNIFRFMRTDFAHFLLSTMTKYLHTSCSSNFLSCLFQMLFDSLNAFQYSRNPVEQNGKVLKWEQNIPCKIPVNSGGRSLSNSPLFVLKTHSKYLTMRLQQITHSFQKVFRNIWYFTHTQ